MTTNDLERLIRAATSGDVDAQFQLAERYRTGEGATQSNTEALRWYRKAAEAGHTNAMCDLGTMILRGMGCDADATEAMVWFRQAAELGNAVGCYNLAKRYLHDLVDYESAYHWFSEAASLGDTESICEIGTMHRFGHGVPRNIAAAAWFHVIAAKEGDVVAMGNLADYLDELQRIALVGDSSASRCMMEIYNLGLAGQKSMSLAWAWAKWAKEHCERSTDEEEAAYIDGAVEFYRRVLDEGDREEGERVLLGWIKSA